jgi:hypothetical protein
VFPIGLLRGLLGLIGIGSAFMAGRTMVAVRKGLVKAGRHYAWMVRAVLCLAALAYRHTLDALMIAAWAFSLAAFAVGWWQAANSRPPEDLSERILPREE